MKSYETVLLSVPLFQGIAPEELGPLLACLGVKQKTVPRDGMALAAGGKVDSIGIVLEGRFLIVREDAKGNRSLLSTLGPGDFFGEALCCAGVEESPVSVVADTDGEVLQLDFQRILHTCSNACSFHTKLLENMLAVLAGKNLSMQRRMELLSEKSIRVRLIRYLESAAQQHGREFSIPMNREELADFLGADRSALSRELSRLKAEGRIDYWKNHFKLL